METHLTMRLHAEPHGPLMGDVAVPGDKSISHRSLMLAGLAVGESRIEGLLEGEDVLATASAMEAMGVEINRLSDGCWQVFGRGVSGLSEPERVLDMGNAGTGARLLLGILAGHEMTAFMTGDASLCRRPMGRVVTPLIQMGAAFMTREGSRLPLAIQGCNNLLPLTYHSPVASAQVKSAVLLAGLHAMGRTKVIEPAASRDHSERLLRAMGAVVTSETGRDGVVWVTIDGQPELNPQRFAVPGDPSSAAFVIAAAACRPGANVRVRNVSVNPLRSGFIQTLREMGAQIEETCHRDVAGEPVADLAIEGRELDGVDVPPERAPAMIDEYPVLAVMASRVNGTTRMRGLEELRVKESDRLQVMADGLRNCGVDCGIDGNDLWVRGGSNGLRHALIDAQLDHRIAMSFLVLGGIGEVAVDVAGAEAIETSFPGFAGLMNGLGANISKVSEQ